MSVSGNRQKIFHKHLGGRTGYPYFIFGGVERSATASGRDGGTFTGAEADFQPFSGDCIRTFNTEVFDSGLIKYSVRNSISKETSFQKTELYSASDLEGCFFDYL